ncbi:MAG: hypothetical protein EP329_19480 [Deltaproteobacteria bacterium]|nr:MAG: hypothetical protein EP329_19480 [Deltaproteobacteria bacterium]
MDSAQSHFVDAEVAHDGQRYRFTQAEGDRLVSRGSYWHGPASPSSWLAVATFHAVRGKHRSLPQAAALALAAASLGITPAALESAITWHENYMRWHDGDPDYHVLEPEEDTPA